MMVVAAATLATQTAGFKQRRVDAVPETRDVVEEKYEQYWSPFDWFASSPTVNEANDQPEMNLAMQ